MNILSVIRRIFSILIAIVIVGCSSSDKTVEDDSVTPPPPAPPVEKEKKAVAVWIDAKANSQRFWNAKDVEGHMKKMYDNGINLIYLMVKPSTGYAMYDSDILPQTQIWGEPVKKRSWDYLQTFIDEGKKYGISVVAAIDAMGYGDTSIRKGLIYDSNKYDQAMQVKMIDHDPNRLESIKDNTIGCGGNLNPAHPLTQQLVVDICRELARKYPDLKGICLDVLRYENLEYCMSDYSMGEFANYIGANSVNRNDLLTSVGGMGTHFAKWVEFRTKSVTDLVEKIRVAVKAENPDCQLHLWSSASWASRYEVGQNWASPKYTPSGAVYTSNYGSLGFANKLDVMVPGAYAEKVWKSEDPNGNWNVEYFIGTYPSLILGDTKVYNSLSMYSYNTAKPVEDAIYLSLINTDGVMLFDICHIYEFNHWDAIKEGIRRGR